MDVKLRKIKENDLERIMNWRMQSSVTKYMNTDPELDLGIQREWFRKINISDNFQYWIIVVDAIDIGILGIDEIDYKNKNCTWTCYIGEEKYRGKGIVRRIEMNLYDYIFYHLKLNRLYSYIHSNNKHIIHNVHERCGSVIEGELKEHIYKNGKYIDVTIMGITANRWKEIRSDYNYEKVEFEE